MGTVCLNLEVSSVIKKPKTYLPVAVQRNEGSRKREGEGFQRFCTLPAEGYRCLKVVINGKFNLKLVIDK